MGLGIDFPLLGVAAAPILGVVARGHGVAGGCEWDIAFEIDPDGLPRPRAVIHAPLGAAVFVEQLVIVFIFIAAIGIVRGVYVVRHK